MCYADDDILETRRKYSKGTWYCFLILLPIALFIIICPVVLDYPNLLEETLNYVLAGVGLLSFAIAVLSIKIAYDSDTKMIENANSQFLHALSDFEIQRVEFKFPISELKYEEDDEFYTWRSLIHLRRANVFDNNFIMRKHHHQLIHYFNVSVNILFNKYGWDKLVDESKNNVRDMNEIAKQYDMGKHKKEFYNLQKKIK